MNAPRLSIACPSSQIAGGVQSWLGYLVPGLERAGWRVTVHLPQGRHSDAHAFARAHGLQARYLAFDNPTGSREGRVRALGASLLRAAPDAVLGVNLVDVYDATARVRRARRDTRLAIGLHGLLAGSYDDLRHWAPMVDGAISPSRLGARAASQVSGLPPERAFHAPCGIELPSSSRAAGDGGTLRIVYAGRFDEAEKRVHDIPRIASELQRMGIDFELVLAGSGQEEAPLRQELADLGDRVTFTGWLPPERLATEIYRSGSILLLTSPSETGPITVWEAMAHGMVVVTSEFLGMRSEGALVPGDNCLSFAVGDTSAAAQRITMLRDRLVFERLADAGRAVVASRYTRQGSIDAWSRALAAILEAPRHGDTAPTAAIPKAGRLDRWFGVPAAETMRRWMRVSHQHASAGAEWPHTYSATEAAGAPDPRLIAIDIRGTAQVPAI